jgi:hypothetical protein
VHHHRVSFDIFLQCFDDDTSAVSDAVRTVLAPFITPPEGTFAVINTNDGEADVYGISTDHLMINHAAGEHIWQVMVEIARAANMAIMPIGCPTCVVDKAMISSLPAELRQEAVVVSSGKELLTIILTS